MISAVNQGKRIPVALPGCDGLAGVVHHADGRSFVSYTPNGSAPMVEPGYILVLEGKRYVVKTAGRSLYMPAMVVIELKLDTAS